MVSHVFDQVFDRVAVIGHQDRAGPRPAIGDLGNVLKRFDVNVVTRQGMTDRCAAAEIAIDQGDRPPLSGPR